MEIVGVIGAGTMGSGIAQVAALAGHKVFVYDAAQANLQKAQGSVRSALNRMEEKKKISPGQAVAIFGRMYWSESLRGFEECDLIVEAIVEDLVSKEKLNRTLSPIVRPDAIVATNTSSISITQLAASAPDPSRFLGLHFFNPAQLMPLVEIIPAVQTDRACLEKAMQLVEKWGKIGIVAKDTPGFIVNRIARPFYTEAIRLYEEGLADLATIDDAVTEVYGFKMGPFELMDFIGHDVNFKVTHSLWEACYCEPRYKPSVSQRNLVLANWLGKKSGKGFYDYSNGASRPKSTADMALKKKLAWRILVMLINEAADAWYHKLASEEDIELAMTKGVNYPKGLLNWGREIGIDACIQAMEELFDYYKEERYRCSPGLRAMKI